MWKAGCLNLSRDRPQSLKKVVTAIGTAKHSATSVSVTSPYTWEFEQMSNSCASLLNGRKCLAIGLNFSSFISNGDMPPYKRIFLKRYNIKQNTKRQNKGLKFVLVSLFFPNWIVPIAIQDCRVQNYGHFTIWYVNVMSLKITWCMCIQYWCICSQ